MEIMGRVQICFQAPRERGVEEYGLSLRQQSRLSASFHQSIESASYSSGSSLKGGERRKPKYRSMQGRRFDEARKYQKVCRDGAVSAAIWQPTEQHPDATRVGSPAFGEVILSALMHRIS